MDGSRFAIVGGGMVAGYAAKQLVQMKLAPGDLTILSSDSEFPYERPPLSKGFLLGKENEGSIRISPPDFYGGRGIDVRLGCTVSAIDPGRRRLRLRSGEEFGFEKLILATGSRARALAVPGADLPGVLYLRTLEDSERIRHRAATARRAVVVGGGFIAMETASVLAQKGIETTMVMPEDRVWQSFFTAEMSEFFGNYFGARGVRFRKGVSVTELRGDTEVESVALADGSAAACDLVIAGVGALPVTGLPEETGIEVNNGVVVNEFLETNVAGIFAAGDIANYPDVLFGKRRRVEHWDNAVSQGQHCAKALMGERMPFVHVPYFFSDVFDLSWEFWGDTAGAENVVYRGHLSTSSFSAWWMKQSKVVAAFAMNRPDEERNTAPAWIQSRQKVDAGRLAGEADIRDAAAGP